MQPSTPPYTGRPSEGRQLSGSLPTCVSETGLAAARNGGNAGGTCTPRPSLPVRPGTDPARALSFPAAERWITWANEGPSLLCPP